MINEMKKVATFAISLLLIGVAGVTSAYAATVAVLVVGVEPEEASTQFAAGLMADATQAGYTVKTDAAVTAKLDELRTKHANNETVDTTGLAAWGKANGIDFVQLVVEHSSELTISGRDQVVQVVTCGTAKYTGRSYYRMWFAAQGTVPCECGECECGECEVIADELVGDMVLVRGGLFQMLESNYYVALNGFYIGKHEVTQRLWKAVMGSNPSNFSGGNLPVENVSWEDITGSGGFLEKLNAMTGKYYRLPTEAEWEYAARGCKAGVCDSYVYSGSDTVDNVAWHKGNSSDMTHAVGTKAANGLGLYDMSGNVWEWCYDGYGSSYPSNTSTTPALNPTGVSDASARVYRGGRWSGSANYCRIALRGQYIPSYRHTALGFRLVLP